MSVLDRGALEESPLADLHAIASELSIDSYRRLRREQLIDAILDRQGDDAAVSTPPEETSEAGDDAETDEAEARPRRRRGRRGGRSRGAGAPAEQSEQAEQAEQAEPEEPATEEDQVVEGEVELLPNGSAFLRVNPPETSDDDVYISAAQVKRCELISGDRISGPRRAPRRSERFASLYKIDTVNGRPASEMSGGVRFDDLPAVFPAEHIAFEDPALNQIDALAPIGKGSRVMIVGGTRSGKTEVLRRLAATLSARDGLQTFVVLVGVRPEEVGEWPEPAQAVTLAASPDSQSQAVAAAIDQGRRIVGRGETWSCCSTRSTASPITPPGGRSRPRATSPTGVR